MKVVLNAVEIVISILIMLSMGWGLSHKGWIDERVSGVIPQILMTLALPGLMIYSVTGNFSRDELLHSGTGLFISFLSILLSYGVGMVVSRLSKVELKRRGTFQVMFAFSNTMFIGLPVNLALFGDKSLPYVLIYYIANTTLFWTIGIYSIRKDSALFRGEADVKESIFTLESVRKIFSPPLISFFIAVILIMLEVKLPNFLMDPFKYMGQLSTPLSMLFIGSVIYSMGFRGIKFDKDMILVLAGRFIITPLIVVAFLKVFNVPDLMGKVFVIQSAMPVVTQSAVTTRAYGGDYKYASAAVTVSTISGLIFIPLYMYLLG